MGSLASKILGDDSDEVVLEKVVKHMRDTSGSNITNMNNVDLVSCIKNLFNPKNPRIKTKELVEYINNPSTDTLSKVAKTQISKEFNVFEKNEYLILNIFENMKTLLRNKPLLRFLKSNNSDDINEFIADNLAGSNFKAKENIKNSLRVLREKMFSDKHLLSVLEAAGNDNISDLYKKIVFMSKNPTSFTHEIKYVTNMLNKIVTQGEVIKNMHNLNQDEALKYFDVISNSKNIDNMIMQDLKVLEKLGNKSKKQEAPKTDNQKSNKNQNASNENKKKNNEPIKPASEKVALKEEEKNVLSTKTSDDLNTSKEDNKIDVVAEIAIDAIAEEAAAEIAIDAPVEDAVLVEKTASKKVVKAKAS